LEQAAQAGLLGQREPCALGALPRLWATFANVAISILRLVKIQGIKRRMNPLRLRPDSAVELLLG